MSDGHEFAIDAGDQPMAADPPLADVYDPDQDQDQAAPPQPMVVIEYRNQGLHMALLPPLLILLVALGIASYQRQSKLRPLTPLLTTSKVPEPEPPPLAPTGQRRDIMVDVPSTGIAIEPIAIRDASPPLATPTPVADPTPATAEEDDEGALASIARPSVEPEPGPRPGVELAVVPPLNPPAPLASAPGEVLPADSPELASRVAPQRLPGDPGPAPGPEPAPEPKLTKEEILRGIEREAMQKEAEQKDLAQAGSRKLHADRLAFHKELQNLLRAMGDGAGADIKALGDQFGRSMPPEKHEAVKLALNRWAARINRKARIDLMRYYDVPEPAILDSIATSLHRTINTRGGPRDPNEVLARAARYLLAYPPSAVPPADASKARPAPLPADPRSVAEAAKPPVRQRARPPQ